MRAAAAKSTGRAWATVQGAMSKVFEEITDQLAGWIARQPMFFVATAPLAPDGHVNVSPKGPIGSLRVLGPRRVAYLDVHGSGAETLAHVRENGRMVIMFCAFQGPPRILRLHGTARPVFAGEAEFEPLLEEGQFEDLSMPAGRRAVIDVEVERISDSCGYGVPLMAFEGMRDHYALSVAKRVRTMSEEGYHAFVAERNALSIDGLPALAPSERVSPA
jgi:Pyridoxamine 5'-phosphate oxidase